MPYPDANDPDYCAGSRQVIEDYDEERQWFRCPTCGRLISAMGKTKRFFDHVSNRRRARRRDAVQEGLTAYGMNKKEPRQEPVYGLSEEDVHDHA
jgi:predicted RNA-binding Zn-ribbon protein involved in translation (DUF1610 family)